MAGSIKDSKAFRKFAEKLLPNEANRLEFINAITNPTRFPQAIIWLKSKPQGCDLSMEPSFSWQPSFVDRVSIGQKPGQNRLHDQGYYYCLDTSSIFEVTPLLAIRENVGRPELIVDVCSSPGGKGIFAWRAFSPRRIVLNEVIKKRTVQLRSNVRRCEVQNAEVTSIDPKLLATQFEGLVDVVLVDAPCSGQSLLAKGRDAFGCFHERIVDMNAKRQRRILAEASNMVRKGGYLLYTTCTFSKEENEENVAWFIENNHSFQPVCVGELSAFQSSFTAIPCYRLWPHQGIGAGGFSALFCRTQSR